MSNKEQEFATVTLTLDDDTELECAIFRIFPAGDKEYIALIPIADSEDEEQDVYLYRYTEVEGGEPILENIETDEEYELVAEAFDEELDAMDYEELYAEEDEEN